MASRGLRDHLGGGFFRYTTDPDWQVPHYEKMLYDNALLASLYLEAAAVLGDARWERVARDTLDFMLAQLRSPAGAFVASLSAVDAGDVEGGAYLLEPAVIEARLDEGERAAAVAAWGLDRPAVSEHGHLPVLARGPEALAEALGESPETVAARLERAREKLLAARAERGLPRDDKLLAGWNGLALSALARAASLPDGERYAGAGAALRDYLAVTLWDGSALSRARGPGGAYGTATLADYAFAAQGLFEWWRHTGASADRRLARALVDAAWARFRDGHGWWLATDIGLPYARAQAALADGAMPSPSAVLIETTLAVAAAGGDAALAQRARDALMRETDSLLDSPFFHATRVRLLAEAAAGG